MKVIMSWLRKFELIYSTVKYLKQKQLFYQIKYRLSKKSFIKGQFTNCTIGDTNIINFGKTGIPKDKYIGYNTFTFLNLEKDFGPYIDWNFLGYGKLWNYNLEYFDYIHQENVDNDEKLRVILNFYKFCIKNERVLEPYPVSLRVINLIKFTCINNVDPKDFHQYIYQELQYLDNHYEFHILGNHLLENAFAMCMGGAFFSNDIWHHRAIGILYKELQEQILSDGAHFELSPMYHNIILFRLLELIDWYSKYNRHNQNFLFFCRDKASTMLSWLENVQFENGDLPLFKDSAKGISYENSFLISYAKFLNITSACLPLGESGYRSFKGNAFEIKMNFAQIGASYQPGHAHADALSFLLYSNNKPLFVEQGTSTYQIGERRNLERSTEAHNTVVVDNVSQSEVWGGFRVGRRAKTYILEAGINKLVGYHDGYKRKGTIHQRSFELNNNLVLIKDSLSNKKSGVAYFHLAPGLFLKKYDKYKFVIDGHCFFEFDQADDITVEKYFYADSYNVYKESQRLKISFTSELKTCINFI